MSTAAIASETTAGLAVSSVFYFLLIPALALWYAYYKISNKRYFELGNKIPGPPGLPLIGNALEFIGEPPAIFKSTYNKSYTYDNIMKVWIGNKLIVFLIDPRDVELILSSNVHLDKSTEYRFFKPWLGDGLLISTGQHWKSHRKLIAPTFHLNVLKSFITLFNQNARDVCDKMRALNGKEFDCHDYMSECTVEILLGEYQVKLAEGKVRTTPPGTL